MRRKRCLRAVQLLFVCLFCVGSARNRFERVQASIPEAARPTIDAWLRKKGTNLFRMQFIQSACKTFEFVGCRQGRIWEVWG